MKKLPTALALSLTAAALAHAQKPHTDREHLGLKGPVKSVTYERATLEKRGGRDVEGRRVPQERLTFDAEGHVTESEVYDEGGSVIYKSAFRYAGGEKIGEELAPPINVGTPPNPAGHPVATPPRPTQPSPKKYKYKYDAEGRVSEWTIEERGRVLQRTVYERKGNRKETRYYEGRDYPTTREAETFDERGNLVEMALLNFETGAVEQKALYTAYEFDARGNWVKRLKTVSEEGQPEARTVEYRTITYH
jgi:YD repeat-containing protein